MTTGAPRRTFATATREAGVLAGVAVAIAAILLVARPDRLPLRAQAEVYELKLPAPVVSVAEAKQLFDDGTVLFVDTRPGRPTPTIPSAFTISSDSFDDDLAAVFDFVYPEDALVLFDDGTMQLASAVASRFQGRGYQNLRILEGGLPAWRRGGGPLSGGENP